MEKNINNLQETTKGFIKYDKPVQFKELEIIGYYPYATARVRGLKIPRNIFEELHQSVIKANQEGYNNKVVLVCKGLAKFGTHDFALFLHNYDAIVGSIDDIEEY